MANLLLLDGHHQAPPPPPTGQSSIAEGIFQPGTGQGLTAGIWNLVFSLFAILLSGVKRWA